MTRYSNCSMPRLVAAAAVLTCCGVALGGGELTAPPELGYAPGGPGAYQAPGPGIAGAYPAGVAGGVYHEYLAYNAYVRRSHMPGYIPQTASLWQNPRTLPASLCKFSDYYRFGNVAGFYFASPLGYTSAVPPGSIAHAYNSGQLGITSSLQYGYPRGMRVIEPIIVPFASHAETGGLLITSDGIAARPVMTEQPIQEYTETISHRIEKTGRPYDTPEPMAPAPAAPRYPSLPEVFDK